MRTSWGLPTIFGEPFSERGELTFEAFVAQIARRCLLLSIIPPPLECPSTLSATSRGSVLRSAHSRRLMFILAECVRRRGLPAVPQACQRRLLTSVRRPTECRPRVCLHRKP